jgi:hypothetical protein
MTIVVAQHYVVVRIAHGKITLSRRMIPALQHVVRIAVVEHIVVRFGHVSETLQITWDLGITTDFVDFLERPEHAAGIAVSGFVLIFAHISPTVVQVLGGLVFVELCNSVVNPTVCAVDVGICFVGTEIDDVAVEQVVFSVQQLAVVAHGDQTVAVVTDILHIPTV